MWLSSRYQSSLECFSSFLEFWRLSRSSLRTCFKKWLANFVVSWFISITPNRIRNFYRLSETAKYFWAKCKSISSTTSHRLASSGRHDASSIWCYRNGLWHCADGGLWECGGPSQHDLDDASLLHSLCQLGPGWRSEGGFPCHCSRSCSHLPTRNSAAG